MRAAGIRRFSAAAESLERPRLAWPAELLAAGTTGVAVGAAYPLADAADALEHVRQGAGGTEIVLQPGRSRRSRLSQLR
jgi:hypothetical protein